MYGLVELNHGIPSIISNGNESTTSKWCFPVSTLATDIQTFSVRNLTFDDCIGLPSIVKMVAGLGVSNRGICSRVAHSRVMKLCVAPESKSAEYCEDTLSLSATGTFNCSLTISPLAANWR